MIKDSLFYLNGASSKAYGCRIQTRPDRISPVRNFYEGSPSNRDGTVLRDKGTFADATLKLSVLFETYNTDKSIDDVLDWVTTPNFVPLVLMFDSEYTYYALVKDAVRLQAVDWLHTIYTFDLNLVVRPYKFNSSSMSMQLITSGATLVNPYNYVARPYISINATSAITLTISSNKTLDGYSKTQSYTIANPGGRINIDCENRITDKPSSFVGQSFPYLNLGTNTITFSGGDSMEIKPKWRRKVG